MTAPHLYAPLNAAKNEIRLLSIQPPTDDSGLLHCRLSVVSLDDYSDAYAAHLAAEGVVSKPRRKDVTSWIARSKKGDGASPETSSGPCRFSWGDYATISYVWGSEAQRKTIVVNGQHVSVTENLEVALRAVAGTGAYASDSKLWVDALCINQADDGERAAQVAKMRDIYSNALSVVAWLGKAHDYSDEAFDLLERLAGLAEASKTAPFGEFGLPSGLFFGYYFSGLNELMRRTYWSRLWVVQELVLGASAVLLRCGERSIDWDTFCAGITVLYRPDLWHIKDELLVNEVHRHGSDGTGRRKQWSTSQLHLVKRELLVLSRYEEQGAGRLGFRRLLDIAGSSDCRDTRDKVFALLGMMEPKVADRLVQDYSIPTPELFASVAKEFITHLNSLEPLREGNPWGQTGAPSWAADWTWNGRSRYSGVETPLWGHRHLEDALEVPPEKVYNAAGGRPAEFSFPNDRLLKCKGVVVGSITGLGARSRGYWRWIPRSIQQCPSWRSVYGGHRETSEALWQTLLLGRMSGGAPAEPRHAAILSLPKSFEEAALPQFLERRWAWMASQSGYYFRWEEWREANDGFLLGDTPLGDFFSDKILEGTEEQDYSDVYAAFRRTSQDRRFMLTSKGYMGWAPENTRGREPNQARPGDLICIVFGCSTPLVIRPCLGDDAFLVIGEAYVQGLMEGQALERDSVDLDHVEFTFT
ncbi:HET-domain-containing protein [Thozetella sp. PMI_491]|nr:HET-domain-containing protein [Thozetella sp. PMI_491]